jgi:hypothetical protein
MHCHKYSYMQIIQFPFVVYNATVSLFFPYDFTVYTKIKSCGIHLLLPCTEKYPQVPLGLIRDEYSITVGCKLAVLTIVRLNQYDTIK